MSVRKTIRVSPLLHQAGASTTGAGGGPLLGRVVLGLAAKSMVAVRMSDAGTLCDGPRGKVGAAMPAVKGGRRWPPGSEGFVSPSRSGRDWPWRSRSAVRNAMRLTVVVVMF